MTKRTAKKQTTQTVSTVNSTAPSKPVEGIKAQTNTTASPKAKQAKTPAKTQKPTLGSEVDRLRDDLVYANLQLSKTITELTDVKQKLREAQDDLYDNYYKSWGSSLMNDL